ncbi:copper resistance protein CopC [Gordonia sp. zg691]|uniref:copper resistance CopC family protein n=1 Tax=Gordonia jinghuaiqii TaxID=2758710 RepID=UPI00166248DD|nr:copper resistance CopC family protein [Gordonia jinghuaiqii]MBD0863975.1 copper resistance protein CopC [Gordonia jinghuaiqii]
MRNGRRVRRPVVLVLAALACLGLVGTWAAPAASAHSRLVSSDPADGATLQTGPEAITLTFNEPVQSSYAVLNVVGPDDHYWQSGEPTVDGTQFRVGVRELGPAGTYVVNYRVTSADGHVISGQRSFNLAVEGNGEPGPAIEAADETSDDGIPVWYFIIGAAVVLVVGLGVVFWLSRRPSSKKS